MRNELVTINNVRGYLDDNNTAWLNLEDVARGLGFTQVKNNKEYVKWERVHQYLTDLNFSTSGEKDFIPENVFYRLCMKANNEVAREFQGNVCDNILPQIRKTGMYLTDNVFDLMMREPERLGEMLIEYGRTRKENEQLKLDNKIKEQQITELQPKAEYTDVILQCKDLVTITVIAKDYGKSGVFMNELLHKLGVQYKESGIWFLYQKYAECGYTRTKTFNVGDNNAKTHTYWTQKGRLFIYNLLKENGYLPIMEDRDYE
nr:MAG TPA: antirepressor protein [Caudoviricetes sp.]